MAGLRSLGGALSRRVHGAAAAQRRLPGRAAHKLIITRSVGGAMSDTMLRGVTFGAYNNAVPQAEVEAAVLAFLSGSGRTCTTTEGTKLAAPRWEFTYSCEVKFTAAP
jgi:hypothetical protein